MSNLLLWVFDSKRARDEASSNGRCISCLDQVVLRTGQRGLVDAESTYDSVNFVFIEELRQ